MDEIVQLYAIFLKRDKALWSLYKSLHKIAQMQELAIHLLDGFLKNGQQAFEGEIHFFRHICSSVLWIVQKLWKYDS